MRYYILNYELKGSQHGGDYYHINMCNENLEEFHTYVYPYTQSGLQIRNSIPWLDIMNSGKGVVLSNLKAKKDAKMRYGSTLINADSIRKAEVEQVFDTPDLMYDHVHELIQKEEYKTGDNSLWEI